MILRTGKIGVLLLLLYEKDFDDFGVDVCRGGDT